jgi:hypothetical protein
LDADRCAQGNAGPDREQVDLLKQWGCAARPT